MKKKTENIIVIILFIFIPFMSFADDDKYFFELNNHPQIDLRAVSNGTYKSIEIEIQNFGDSSTTIHFPPGGIFLNLNKKEQNLAILYYDKIEVNPNEKKYLSLHTACANPDRIVPKKGRTTWDFSYDRKLSELLIYYVQNQSMIEMLTGKEYHTTFEKRHNFLQMCVWVYYDAEKDQIVDFATKNLFNGNKEQAKAFVDLFYPIAVNFIKVYKNM